MNFRQPLIIDIEGNSFDDGPGIRSVIFFKGCPLDCIWCHNPESKKTETELWWDNEKCIDCGECIEACIEDAISRDNPIFIDRQRCNHHFYCVAVCPSKALVRVGTQMSIDEIVKKVIRYKPFFDSSGGGVTLSGGEATLPIGFTSMLLKRFKEEGIHTLLETAGLFTFEKFESLILPYVDMIYFDIKLIDSLKHNYYCGVSNEQILDNFARLLEKSKSNGFELISRTPIIPGITDNESNINAIAKLYNKLGIKKAVLLLNNPAWLHKFNKLGQETRFCSDHPIQKFYDDKKKKMLVDYFLEHEIEMAFG